MRTILETSRYIVRAAGHGAALDISDKLTGKGIALIALKAIALRTALEAQCASTPAWQDVRLNSLISIYADS
jgi:hypothetical protein